MIMIGNGSLSLTLPRDWVKENRLQKKGECLMMFNEEVCVVVPTNNNAFDEIRKKYERLLFTDFGLPESMKIDGEEVRVEMTTITQYDIEEKERKEKEKKEVEEWGYDD